MYLQYDPIFIQSDVDYVKASIIVAICLFLLWPNSADAQEPLLCSFAYGISCAKQTKEFLCSFVPVECGDIPLVYILYLYVYKYISYISIT